MRVRALTLLALIVLVPALRAEEKTKAPTLTLRVRGLDDLVADIRYLADQAGRGEEAKQFEGLLKAMAGDKGLEGFDTKKPMALYAFAGAAGIDSKVVLLLPVADQQTFLATLKRLGLSIDKEKNGIYETQPKGSPVPAHFRFAHGYVYATLGDADAITDKALLLPAVVLPPGEKDLVSLSVDLTGFPEGLRDIALGQLNVQLTNLKEKQEGETKVQHAFRMAVLDDTVGFIKSLLTDSGQVTFRFTVDRQAGDISMSAGLAGKAGSPLAKSLSALGKTMSAVASLVGDDSAMATRLTLELPEDLRKKLAPVIDEGLAKALADANQEEVKALLKPLLEAIAPTLKQGKVDLALDFRGPSEKKLYTIVAAAGIKDGAGIEKAVKAALEKLPAEVKEKVSIDVAKAGEVNIHRLNVEKDQNEATRKTLGENPAYFAVRNDAVFFALGDGGLAALKDVLGAKPKTAEVMRIDMSLLRAAALIGTQQKAAPKAAQEAFGKEKGSDRVSFSLEGGQEFRLRLGIKGALLRFFYLLDKAEQEEKKTDQ